MTKFYFIASLVFCCSMQLSGQASITEAGVTVGGTTYVEPVFFTFQGRSFTVTQGGDLAFSFAYVKTTKANGADVCGASVFYSVYPAAGSPSFTSINLPYASGSNDQEWNTNLVSPLNLAMGLTPGAYKIAFYYTALANQTQSCSNGSSTLFFSNSGNNFVADLTITAPAPVTLVNFSTRRDGAQVQIEWQTATERNSQRFEVEHSADMQDWRVIGTRTGANNSSTLRHYAFRHEQPAIGDNYYRLRQVDIDGKSEYSPIRKISLSGRGVIGVAPNPVTNGTTFLRLNGLKDDTANIRLMDAFGRLLREWKVATENDYAMPIDLSDVPSGVLFLFVNGETVRIVKE